MRPDRHHRPSFRRSASERPPGRSAARHGYTLLELMLAVSVLMVIASISVSPVMNTWRDNRLAGAAEDVRSLLAGSRVQALDRDETWQFRYEPGGTMFIRVPVTAVAEGGRQAETTNTGRLSGALPEGITFAEDSPEGNESGVLIGTTMSNDLLSGLPDANELTQANWSDPIYFYPDGTAEPAEFELTDEHGGVRRITVRDLTGAVSVSRQNDTSNL